MFKRMSISGLCERLCDRYSGGKLLWWELYFSSVFSAEVKYKLMITMNWGLDFIIGQRIRPVADDVERRQSRSAS